MYEDSKVLHLEHIINLFVSVEDNESTGGIE